MAAASSELFELETEESSTVHLPLHCLDPIHHNVLMPHNVGPASLAVEGGCKVHRLARVICGEALHLPVARAAAVPRQEAPGLENFL